MISVIGLLAAAAASATSPAGAAAPWGSPGFWERGPTHAEIAKVYPPNADGDGKAMLDCKVTAEGMLSTCIIADEEPIGQGFGSAALTLAPLFKVSAQGLKARPADDRGVTVIVLFRRPQRVATITNPDWVKVPDGKALERYFPPGASSTGRAVMECTVQLDGTLADCSVVSEDPPDQGFGAALLKMAKSFKMKPETKDGLPVGGAKVTIPLRFGFSGIEPPKFVRLPTDAELEAVWPADARGEGGSVVLDCMISNAGRAKDCKIAKELPRGKGFGEAALKLAPQLELVPGKNNGSVDAMRANLPIIFPAPRARQSGVGSYGDLSGLSNAPWLSAPSWRDVLAAWPKGAPATFEVGHATLRCGFTRDGKLKSCSVENEDPAGAGFGAAALSLTGRFQMRGADPSVMEQARINLPFAFTNPATAGSAPPPIRKADWVAYVSADELTSLYPEKAARAGVKSGRGVVACTVASDGTLKACASTSEEPADLGFGAAAVATVSLFTLNLWTFDGEPVDGAQIVLPVRLVQPEPAVPSNGSAQDQKPSS
jgi:TonB family protein